MNARARYEFNAKEFAAILWVTTKTLINWEKEGMPSPAKPARNASYFDLRVHLPWILSNKGQPPMDDRARKARADADMAEKERDEMAGSLVSADGAAREYADALSRLHSNLMGFGDRLIPLLAETTNPREQLVDA